MSDVRFLRIAPTVVLLTYKANQVGTDHGKPLPLAMYVSSVWVNRDGKWLNVLAQDTPEASVSSSLQLRQKNFPPDSNTQKITN